MTKSKILILSIFITTVALSGCAKLKSIYRTVDLNVDGGGPSLVMDAAQRLVTNVDIVNNSVPGQVVPKRIVCAEPSPDIALAFSNATKAAIAQTTASTSNSASLSVNTAQSFGQLGERLATIQLLRDIAYRNCEAYANGSINATSYTILNSRLNKTIVTLLSTEIMAGAFGRNLAASSASSVSNSDSKPSNSDSNNENDTPENSLDNNDSSKTNGESKAAIEQSVGNIGEQQQPSDHVASQIAQLHRSFIEDNSFVTLIDACVAHMNQILVSGKVLESDSGILSAIEQAQKLNDQSSFTKICATQILPKAVDLAETKSVEDNKTQQLRIIESIVSMCKDNETKDTPGCNNLGMLLNGFEVVENSQATN